MLLRVFMLAVTMAAALPLAACSTYDGPVTNAPQPAGVVGLPLLTNHYAP